MNANHTPQPQATGPNPQSDPVVRGEKTSPDFPGLLTSIAIAAGLLLVAIALGLLITSCGGEKTKATSSAVVTPSATDAAVASVTETAESIERSAHAAQSLGGEPSPNAIPDLDCAVTRTNVAPGDTVEVIARTTPDAVSVTLSDGYQDPQALTHDPTSNLWRGVYRVPLHASWERLGLSVTARNDANRWRRVWVFLTLPDDETASPAEPDSSR